ncbi:MAG: hypothetical protein J0L82_18815 [Deltaproteobacteria bacterium]|nr:hypothetical protein [Deltaproteobacteria bacterium]
MKTALVLLMITMANSTTWAAQTVAPFAQAFMSKKPSLEERERLAIAHEQMAICLRSELDFADCHDVLQEDCQSMTGGPCPTLEADRKRRK